MTSPSSNQNPRPSGDKGPDNGDRHSSNQPHRSSLDELIAGDIVGPFVVRGFYARGGNSRIYSATGKNGISVALKMADEAGGGKWVMREMEVTGKRLATSISPDETPSDNIIAKPDGGFEISFLEPKAARELIIKQHKILSTASHENLVHLVGEGIQYVDGQPVLTMKYAAGQTLRETLRELHPVRLNWFLTITRALISLNKSGKLDAHRCLKPEDILITGSGKVILLDPSPHPDEFGGRLVTSPYYNPFLLKSAKADVMAMGIMIYEIMTGILPFDEVPYPRAFNAGKEDTDVEDLFLSHYLSYPPMRELNRNSIAPIEKIVHHCLTVPEYGLKDLEREMAEFLRSRN